VVQRNLTLYKALLIRILNEVYSIPGGTTFKRLIIKQLLIKVAAFFISFCVFFGGFSMIFSSHVNQDVNRKKKWL